MPLASNVDVPSDLLELAREHLRRCYQGVFSDAAVERHISEHIGFLLADDLLALVEPRITLPAQILDVGSGFGSFVLRARVRGFSAIGVETEEFEVSFARRRFQECLPHEDPTQVYHHGDGSKLPFGRHTFDVVTLWNVLEHVRDARRVLSEAVRVLRPGGVLFLICPNYASFRSEAHYSVFWPPLFPRRMASAYLRFRGRAPAFFEDSIFYRTNREVLAILEEFGMKIFDPRMDKIKDPMSINNPRLRVIISAFRKCGATWILETLLTISFRNPFRRVVLLYAKKGLRS